MNTVPAFAWRAAKEVMAGIGGHMTKPTTMRLRRANGELATNPQEKMEVLSNLEKVFNTQRPRSANAADLIALREVSPELDVDISFREFKKAVMKLKNDKAPGITGVMPNALKVLEDDNLRCIYGYVVDFWEGKTNNWQWHTGLNVMVPKKGDLSDPNKWRGINLMDVVSKALSNVLVERLYVLLAKHGIKSQFGATPGVGCQDGLFTLKTLLHQRHQHNLESYVIFADLVKAYDTTNHDLLVEVLERYGAPPKICSVVRRLYTDLKVLVNLDGTKAEIEQSVGVRQGDNHSPVLFLFMMSAFAESLETEWRKGGFETAKFTRTTLEEIEQGHGKLIGHSLRKDGTYGPGDIFNVLQILYLDDGAFIFTNREDAERGAHLIAEQFKKFGMEMHVGVDGKTAKTEALYVPVQAFYKDLPRTIQDESDSSSRALVKMPTTKEKESAISKLQDLKYDTCEETKQIVFPNGHTVDFTKHFKYLGSFVSYTLKDDYEIDKRIKKAKQQMGALSTLWYCDHIDLYSKYLFFQACILNQLLWGCESWAIKESSFDKLDVFLHVSIRKILRIRMRQVKEDRISNAFIRQKFYGLQDIRKQIAARTLKFVGKVIREENYSYPKQLLTSWVDNKRPRGRPITTNKQSVVKALQLIYPASVYTVIGEHVVSYMDSHGSFKYWIKDALDKKRWTWMIESKLVHPDRDIPEPSQDEEPTSRPRRTPRSPPRARPSTPPRARRDRQQPPSPHQPPSPRAGQQTYNEGGVGRNMRDFLAILGLTMSATERDIRRKYMQMARTCHPDKNDPAVTGRNNEEATHFFQLLGSAYRFLRGEV